MSPQLYTTHPT